MVSSTQLNSFGYPSWSHLQIFEVQVSLVLVGGLVSTMAVADDWVEEILEQLI